MNKRLLFVPLVLLAVLLGGCNTARPFVDLRLMDHKTGDERSSIDAGISIPTSGAVLDVGLALDFDFGGNGGSPAGDTLAGFRFTYRAK